MENNQKIEEDVMGGADILEGVGVKGVEWGGGKRGGRGGGG